MMSLTSLLVIVLSAALAASNVASYRLSDEDYSYTLDKDIGDLVVPQKRAALVLDRLLIALQKALHEESKTRRLEADDDGPRTAPLRDPSIESYDVAGVQRRGQGTKGRVLRCYFNAVTCF